MTREQLLARALEWIDGLLESGGPSPLQRRVLVAMRAVVAADEGLLAQICARLGGRDRMEDEATERYDE